MGKKFSLKFNFLLIISSLCFLTVVCAETVILKSGEEIKGKIIEKTDKYIKVDFQEVPITYYLDEVTSIDGQSPSVLPEIEEDKGIRKDYASENIDKNKIVEEILELSGFRKQIENFPSVVQAQLAESKNKLKPEKPEVFEIVSKTISESYKSETMYQVVSDNLIANFDMNYYTVLLNWLHSPLSKKMSQLEEQASTPQALQEMKEFAAKLQYAPPSKERVALVQALDEAVDGTNLTIEMITLANLQMFKAIEMVIPEAQRTKEDNWEEKFKSTLRAQLEQPMKQNIRVSFLYIYRSVSDEELKAYIDFWDSDEGRWSNKILSQAFLDAIVKVSREMGNKLIKELSQVKVNNQGMTDNK
ncbi:MAG: hypothetical protein AAB089_02610 [Nitrospirota bacterium]